MRAAAGWLALMLAAAVGGSFAAYAAAVRSDYFLDPVSGYNAAYGFTLPVHMVQAAHPGWPVLAVIWTMLAIFGFAGWKLAAALRMAGSAQALAIWGYVIIALALSFFAIVQSVDVYYYVTFGRVFGIHGLNPYFLTTPLQVPNDASLQQIFGYVKNPPYNDPYGPAWTLMAGFVAKASGALSLYWQVWVYRLIAIVAGVATLAGVRHALRAAPAAEQTQRTAVLAFHPLFLYETAVGAHNEILMVAPAVWAFALVDELPLVAALLMGVSIAVKYLTVIALPFLLWRAFVKSPAAGILGLALALAVPILCFKPFWVGSGALNAAAGHANVLGMSPTWLIAAPLFAAGLGSTPAFDGHVTLPLFGVPTWPRVVELTMLLAFVAVAIFSFARFVRHQSYADVWRTITAFLWASPIIHPWYLLMLAPATAGLGAARTDRWAIYAWWFCALIPLRYVLEGVSGAPTSWLVALTAVFLVAPVVIALRAPASDTVAATR